MRKYKYFLSFLILTIALSQNIFAEKASFKPFTGKVIAQKVRIRTSPDLDGYILKQLNKDTLLLVLDEKSDYYAVKPFHDTKMYVYKNYVSDNIVKANKVNIRLKPNLSSPILGQLNNKQTLDGEVYKKDNKWMEIYPPEEIYFYVSKHYIDRAGDSTYYTLMLDRREEVSKIINSAFFLTQAECKKPFNEMEPQKAISQFEAVVKGYTDFPEYVQQAKEGLALLQDNYLQKKIVYLETKANMAPEEKEELFKEVASLKSNQEQRKSQKSLNNLSAKALFNDKSLPTNMKIWIASEKNLFSTWSTFHPDKSIDDFYNEQKANAITITGVIENYNQPIQNKPGDFLLKGENIPLAYLYSINVDLSKYIGKKITIIASPRPNNNFAFPAYFVNAIE